MSVRSLHIPKNEPMEFRGWLTLGSGFRLTMRASLPRLRPRPHASACSAGFGPGASPPRRVTISQLLSEFVRADPGLAENPAEELGADAGAPVEGDHNLPGGIVLMPEGDVRANLVIAEETEAFKGPNYALPGQVPGKLGHTDTSTVASSIASSRGIGSPCF